VHEIEYDWKDILFKEKIQEVVRDEEAIPTNSDWAVKLGINLAKKIQEGERTKRIMAQLTKSERLPQSDD
ncbi:hypothetical protein ACJX0J_035696, partial [Zea mays]